VTRRFLRAAASVAVVLGWVLCLLWLSLSISQIAVGRVSLPTCSATPPPAALMTAPELNRAILKAITQC
jgi:hypothetical protein